ncbi:MAG: CHAT domain-containing protein [Methylomonas sp.]|uniref:CHAT domain-containing protein n=1 Tax=Methylomonas sp. TaxID=418 RepID=UPI0025E21EA1|nr:CHAT domain-containing protein [Methylomonas sp.]MCK9605709.1 CHAT domain-containing protein [Methylomonas sp.]
MKIFLSYASPYRAIADDLCCRLQAAGHEVFFDREDLPPGTSFDDRIHSAIQSSELFIFLIAPEAVADGHYTRTELKIASRKWPTPGWHVLPVQVAETPLKDVPAYLRALTIMQAEGNLAAEVVLEVQNLLQLHSQEAQPKTSAPTSPLERLSYRSLPLRFGRDTAGGYSLALAESVAGGLRLDTAELEQLLWSGAEAIDGSARRSANDSSLDTLLPSAANAREVGRALYNAVFNSSLRDNLAQYLRAIDPQRGQGLRFVIDTTEVPDLARLPWEFLYSPAKDDFLFSDRMKPIVRWLDVDELTPTLAVEPPLRILLVIAAPTDRPGLRVGEELAHLDSALAELTASGQVKTVRLDHASLESLDNALLQTRPHILHFIGHGDFVADEGLLVFESDSTQGVSDTIAGRQLAVLLRNHLAYLRLVFLNSCMGAAASRVDPFGGVAQSLIRRGIPAVIAMQFPIPDRAAVALSRHFYRYLAAGQPVDAALTSARAFLYARGYAVEWGAPALHMRSPDGRLFDIAELSGPVAALIPQSAPVIEVSDAVVTASPHRNFQRSLIVPIVIGLLFIGAAGIWWRFSSESVPDVNVAPSIDKTPASNITDGIQRALGHLRAGDSQAAAELLDNMLKQDDSALSAEQLGARHDPLALALGNAADKAFLQGDSQLGYRLMDILLAMGPFDEALEQRINAQVGAWLGRGVGWAEAIEVSPGAASSGDADAGRWRYTVRSGDTLWSIARRLTGEGRQWPTLQTYHNQLVKVGMGGNLIADPQRIYPGQKIFIKPSAVGTEENVFDYYVSRGETLSGIALRMYGQEALWHVIYQDNADSIADPGLIYPGQVLHLRRHGY